jgi:hypothetical protein
MTAPGRESSDVDCRSRPLSAIESSLEAFKASKAVVAQSNDPNDRPQETAKADAQ